MPNALLIIIHPFDDQSKRKYNGAVVPSVNSFTELKQQKNLPWVGRTSPENFDFLLFELCSCLHWAPPHHCTFACFGHQMGVL